MAAMTAPTKPHTSAQLLASAALLTFRATARDRSGSTLGVLVDAAGVQQHLVIEPSGGDDGSWALSSAPSAGKKPILLYESAANVLRGGKPTDDDRISYQGGLYTIQSMFDGEAWTAKVSASA
jgi:hypothetical protein